jgi:hypothetical protein
MTDPLDQVLRLVAEGRLTAEEAAPVIDALEAAAAHGAFDAEDQAERAARGQTGQGSTGSGAPGRPRVIRLEVSEDGRKVVNLRIPLSLGRMGLDRIPGLSTADLASIRQALDAGLTGPILSVDEDDLGNGVRIVLE